MNKQNKLAYFTLILVGLFSLFSINISAQNKVIAEAQTPSATDKVLQNYINLSSLSMDERRTFFREKLSPADRANVFKFHLAFQFVKRPNLNNEQKGLILEAISMVKSDSYDERKVEKRSNARQEANVFEQKVKTIFQPKEGFDIFASLGGDEIDVSLLRVFQQTVSFKFDIERRSTFRGLSNQNKSNVMRIHLALEGSIRNLNKEQWEFIEEAFSVFSSKIYGFKKGTTEWNETNNKLNSLKDRMLILFESKDASEIFASLGGEKGLPQGTENLAPNCSCSGVSDYCGWWRNGASCSGGSCRSQIGGCGTGLYYDCDGMCTGGAV